MLFDAACHAMMFDYLRHYAAPAISRHMPLTLRYAIALTHSSAAAPRYALFTAMMLPLILRYAA